MDIREVCESLLAEEVGLDLNAEAETTLFTCPAGKSCIITKVILKNADGAVTQASISFGWNTANADDVIANGVRSLSGTTNYEIIPAASDAVRGAAGGTFKVEVQTAEGGAQTADILVFGILY